jgi:hypothetical protein
MNGTYRSYKSFSLSPPSKELLYFDIALATPVVKRASTASAARAGLFCVCMPIQIHRLLLAVTTTLPATAGFFELPALGPHVRFGVTSWETWSTAKMSASLAGFPRSLNEDCVPASGTLQCKLVKSVQLATGGKYSGPGAFSHTKGNHLEFGDVEETHVIGDCTDYDSQLSSTSNMAHVFHQIFQRQWRSVDSAHEKSL